MNPSVEAAEPLDNYKLKIHFDNGEVKVFDVAPFLDKGIFVELKDKVYFSKVSVAFGAVQWPNEQDFSNDTLYLLGVDIQSAA
jgi:hypothetical protein